jgi:O-antigen/teichoic acid export membrane protein
MIGLGLVVLNGAGYLFNVACIRYLGPSGYGDVAALLSLTALMTVPLASFQTVIAREVAQLGSSEVLAALFRRCLVIGVLVGISLLGIGLALTIPAQRALSIASPLTVAMAMSGLGFAVLTIVMYGFLQGLQRFFVLGVTYAISGLSRPALVVPALLLGFGASGAMAANSVAGLLAAVIAGAALHSLWRGRSNAESPRLDRGQVMVMLVGSLGFASLTNADVILASLYLDNDSAGIYAAAALVGKAVLYFPGAVVTVLLPAAATRAAAGAEVSGVLLASLAGTAFFTLTAAGLLALVPEGLLTWAFGPAFRESTALLGWLGLAMAALAIVNVYLSVYFAERNARFPTLVFGAAVAQIAAVSLWHPDPLSIVLVTLACGVALLVIHEVSFPYSLARIWLSRRLASPDQA